MPKQLKPEEVRHGEIAGAQWHKKQGEKPCEPCRIARNEYERKRRGKPVMISKSELVKQFAFQSRVLKRLAALHPHDHKRIIDEELRKLKQKLTK